MSVSSYQNGILVDIGFIEQSPNPSLCPCLSGKAIPGVHMHSESVSFNVHASGLPAPVCRHLREHLEQTQEIGGAFAATGSTVPGVPLGEELGGGLGDTQN